MLGLTFFASFAAAVLLPPVVGLLPPLRKGRAFNGIAHIAMPDRTKVYFETWEPVLAQEVVEWWAAWAGAFLIALPLAFLIAGTPFAIATPLAAVLAWQWRNTSWGTRQLEYIGWAAEWAWAHRTGVDGYDDLDAYGDRLRRGYVEFSPMSGEEVTAALKKRLLLGRVLATLLWLRIKRASAPRKI